MKTLNQSRAAEKNAVRKSRLEVKGVVFDTKPTKHAFYVEVELTHGLFKRGYAEKAKDLIGQAQHEAYDNVGHKVRIMKVGGTRAVHCFISKDGKTLSRY